MTTISSSTKIKKLVKIFYFTNFVQQGEWDTADLLLTWGSSIEGPDQAGRTPLITAASNGHLGVLELLLSRGSSITI